jgi:hypothetical protein
MESLQRLIAFALVGLMWLSGSLSSAQQSQCVKTPFQRTLSAEKSLPVDNLQADLSAAYHLPPQGLEVEQLSVRVTTEAIARIFIAAASLSVKVQGQRADHQMDGWGGSPPQSWYAAPGAVSQALHVYADGDTNVIGKVTVVASPAVDWDAPIPITVDWIVSGRLVTPGCWSAPQ